MAGVDGKVRDMSRRTLGLITFGLLAALFLLAVTLPIGGTLGAVLFAVVVVLVAVWFFRFSPHGDLWEWAEEVGINPWLGVVLVVLIAVAWLAFRLGLLESL
jgi:hypothetical protein